MKVKQPKAPSKRKIERQCLDLWSLCVRTKARKCAISGSDSQLQAHHIRSVSNKATFLDLENGLCLSSRVHILQKFSPEKFQDMVIDCIGAEEYQRLKVKSQREFKPTVPWLLAMKDQLKTELRRLEAEYGKLY